jgi:hypothetical protein
MGSLSPDGWEEVAGIAGVVQFLVVGSCWETWERLRPGARELLGRVRCGTVRP